MSNKNGNGHIETTDIQKRIEELEKEVAELRPNGSCREVRRDADALLARIQELKQQQQRQEM